MGCKPCSNVDIQIPFDYSQYKIKLYWFILNPSSRSLQSILAHGSVKHEDKHVDVLNN